MAIYRLSESQVRDAKPHKKTVPTLFPGVNSIRYQTQMLADGGGLYLQVTGDEDAVHKSWIFRYAVQEKVISKGGRQRQRERQMGLGPLHTVSLTDARTKALACRKLILEGIDPLEAARRGKRSNGAIKKRRVNAR